MINDLQVPGVKLWKYVDDVTMSEFIEKNQSSNIQEAVNDLVTWPENNKFQVNEQKCKELRITFRIHQSALEPITANNNDIKNVESAKLLGITISNDLKWNAHVQEIICKVATRLYFLRQLKRSNLGCKDLLLFYITCIRPVTEYACQVFHNSLPKYLCEDLERLQKRALRIIYPGSSYSEALIISGLSTLEQRRHKLTESLFKEIVNDEHHKLSALLPLKKRNKYSLRNTQSFQIKFKTNRFRNCFINFNSINFQQTITQEL